MPKSKVIMLIGLIIVGLAVATYIMSRVITGTVTPMPGLSPTGKEATDTPSVSPSGSEPTATPQTTPNGNETPTTSPTEETTATPNASPTGASSSAPTNPPGGSATNPPAATNPTPSPSSPTESNYISNSTTVAEELTVNKGSHEEPEDYVWDNSKVIDIALNANSITVSSSSNATVDGTKVTITSGGNYRVHGTLTNGQLIVDTEDEGTVRLMLDGVDISCSTSAPIYVMNASKTIIILEGNTENHVTDGAAYVFENPEEDEPNAAIFSRSDLTIFGSGTLRVDANFKDGVASKDGLIIASGTVIVDSADDGIRGRDYLIVKNGNITLNAGGVGLKSDNDENAPRGYILAENGEININSSGDAIEGETDVLIANGNFVLTSGGGSGSSISAGASAKGIKASVCIIIEGGTFAENTADDAINSNGKVTINGGAFAISTGDDAIHADISILVRGGDFDIAKSYEGIESAIITINAGDFHIKSSDDGINIAGGKDASGFNPGPGLWGPPPQDSFSNTANYHLYINGGYIYVDADGDGIDSNGAVTMTGGRVIIDGPTSFMNVAVDHDSPFNMTGGFLLGVGSSGTPIAPAQGPSTMSTQYSVLANFNLLMQSGTIIHIQSSNGTEICTFKPTKAYRSIVLCSPDLTSGTTYDIYYGGSSTGMLVDGLYLGGSYTSGTKYASFTISSIVTRLN